jgi:ubiquitin-like protein Pup
MAEQKKKEKQSSAPQEEVEEVEAKDLTNAELNEDVDDILADIDEALGEISNAEEWVMGYKQAGGE